MGTAIAAKRTDRRRIGETSPVSPTKKGSMTILIDLDNQHIAEAIRQLLVANGRDAVVAGEASSGSVIPDVLLVDITTLRYDLLARYPRARAFLIEDAGIGPQRLCRVLLSYGTRGVLPPHPGLRRVRINHGAVKASFRMAGPSRVSWQAR